MHRCAWIGKDFADLFCFCGACPFFYASTTERVLCGFLFFEFFLFLALLISLLKWHELRKDMTSAYVDYISSQAFTMVSLTLHTVSPGGEGVRLMLISVHAFCFKALLLALPFASLWGPIFDLSFFPKSQEKNEETKRVCLLLFLSLYLFLLGGMIPIHLLRCVLDILFV
jgi:hypothetical protein